LSGIRSRRSHRLLAPGFHGRGLAIGALALVVGLTLAATAAGGFTPSTGSPVVVGNSPYGLAVGDLNHDGNVDMVAGDAGSNSVAVMLADDSGGFTEATGSPFTVPSGPFSLALGDLNGDHELDLAVVGAGDDVVTVLRGDGAGGFGSPTSYPVGATPFNLALVDLNGDGRLDLVTADFGPSSVSVLLGDSSGGFSAATDFPAGTQATTLAVGDLNSDGKPDLVAAADGSSTVSVLLGGGGGGFASPLVFDAGSSSGVNSVAVGDVNGDGRPDVAAAGGNHVSVLLGQGGGALGAPTTFAVGSVPYSVALHDLDGDGKLDLVTADLRSNTVSLLLGTGLGGFGPATSIPVGHDPTRVVVADMNKDGKPDVVVAESTSNSVSVLLNTFELTHGTPVTPTAPQSPVVPDTEAPGAPGALHGHFLAGSLILDWQAAADNVAADHYELRLDTVLPLLAIPAGTERASTRVFHRTGKSVYTVTAIDAAGNQSSPSGAVTVVPTRRPALSPTAAPRWAWKLLAWQLHGRQAVRPATPRTLPAWYAAWKTWRQHPFRVAG
jgi:hypothetical protein